MAEVIGELSEVDDVDEMIITSGCISITPFIPGVRTVCAFYFDTGSI